MQPIAVEYGGNVTKYSDEDILKPISFFSDGQLNRHWKAICAAFETSYGGVTYNTAEELDSCVKELLESWNENPLRPSKGMLVDARREVLEETEVEDLEDIAALFNLIGIPVSYTHLTLPTIYSV